MMQPSDEQWISRLGKRGARLRKAYVAARVALWAWAGTVVVTVLLRTRVPELFNRPIVVDFWVTVIVASIVVIFLTQILTLGQLVKEIENRTGFPARRIGWECFFRTTTYDYWLERKRASGA